MKLGNNYAKELQVALQGDNAEVQEQAWANFSQAIVDEIKADAEIFAQSNDRTILAQRGYRQLTSQEERFYDKFIEASKARNVQQAVVTLADDKDAIMPETIIEQIFEDLVEAHPLLAKVNFQNAQYATKIIMNDHSKQSAVWGEIDAEITKEIVTSFKELSLVQNKLSAFAVIPMGLLDLGKTF